MVEKKSRNKQVGTREPARNIATHVSIYIDSLSPFGNKLVEDKHRYVPQAYGGGQSHLGLYTVTDVCKHFYSFMNELKNKSGHRRLSDGRGGSWGYLGSKQSEWSD